MRLALPAKIFFLALVIGALTVLSYLIDNNLGWSWPINVIRNWQQFGFLNLHGQLICNAGGFEVKEHPQAYKGMSPASLYPAYLVTEMFRWTGLDLLSFLILLALVVIWASHQLMGRDNLAMILAAATVLCPGYLRWPKLFDPNSLSVLPVLPYAVIVLAILKRPKLTAPLAIALVVLTLAFMSLNWTTAWVCGPCLFLFFGTPGLNRRGLIMLLAVMVVCVPLVAAVSFAAKFGSGHAGGGSMNLSGLIAGYTWGSGGYGEGLTTGRAFVRLAFVNGVGLFPLWIGLTYVVVLRLRGGREFSWLMFAPLALTVADIIFMRNYFGHHPWMAGPLLVVGIIFSVALLRNSPETEAAVSSKNIPLSAMVATVVVCFAYGFAVLAFFRANEEGLLTLMQLVRHHTTRSDTLVIFKADSATARLADRLTEPLDRRIIVVDDVKELANEKSHCVILSAVKLDDSLALSAESTGQSQSFLTRVADWFNHSIAKRAPGDRLELAETYYLYLPGQ